MGTNTGGKPGCQSQSQQSGNSPSEEGSEHWNLMALNSWSNGWMDGWMDVIDRSISIGYISIEPSSKVYLRHRLSMWTIISMLFQGHHSLIVMYLGHPQSLQSIWPTCNGRTSITSYRQATCTFHARAQVTPRAIILPQEKKIRTQNVYRQVFCQAYMQIYGWLRDLS